MPGAVGQKAEQVEPPAVGVVRPRLEIRVGEAAMQLRIEPPHIPAHPVERESHALGGPLGVIGEIKERRVQEVWGIFGPVDSQAVKIRIVPYQVPDQSVLVAEDLRACEAAVLCQPPLRDCAVGQACPVLLHRASELYPVARRNRRLDLEVDTNAALLGGGNEVPQQMALAAREIRRLGRLIAKASVQGLVRFKTRRGSDPDLALPEQRAIQQANTARVRICGWLALAGLPVRFLHQVGRGGNRVGADPGEVVEKPLDALALDVLREHSDSQKLARSHGA